MFYVRIPSTIAGPDFLAMADRTGCSWDGRDEEGFPCFEVPEGKLEALILEIRRQYGNHTVSVER